MIIYVDTKSGKVDITKAKLEKLLKEKYDEGYKDGKKFCGTITYSCPYGYGSCPYYYKWPYYSPIIYTSTNTSTEGTITCENSITSNTTIGSDSTYANSTTGTITFKEK